MLIKAVDLGLIGALFAVPFLMGGRHPLGQLALVVLACWTAMAWAAYLCLHPQTKWTWTRAEPLLLACVGLGLLQIVHLPAGIVHRLSPHIAEVLPLWTANAPTGASFGPWTQLSLVPAASQSGLVTFVAYALIFVVTAQRLRRVEDVERLLRWIGICVASMAAFGLVQYLTANGKFFWFYEHPYTSTRWALKGSFTNKNHFAHFLALGTGPLIWWVMRLLERGPKAVPVAFAALSRASTRREVSLGLLGIALATVALSGLLSLSRGGAVSMLVAALICVGVLYRYRLVSGKLFAGLTATGLLLGAGLCIFGYEAVSNRLDNWESPGRWMIWRANLAIASDFPLFGTGIGSHVHASQRYVDPPLGDREFTHAENGYLQVASETGLVGLSLSLLAVGICFWWCIRGIRLSKSTRTTAAFAAITAGLGANALHSCFDFVWYVPGCMVVVVLLAACACRLYQMTIADCRLRIGRVCQSAIHNPQSAIRNRLVGVTSLGGLAVLGVWMIQTKLPLLAAESHWREYLMLSLARGEQDEEPGNGLAGRKLSALVAAARANPHDARVQLRTARSYLALFRRRQQNSENAMPLAQIRDAAQTAEFESPTALSHWLGRAIGKNRKLLEVALWHTRRALSLCPLQGRGYLYMAELGFLEGADRNATKAYVKQAQVVQPYDAQVLFVAGREAWLANDFELAVTKWRGAFHRDDVYQREIIDLLAPYVSANFFIEKFEPDWHGLRRLRERFRGMNRPDDYAIVSRRFAKESAARARKLRGRESLKSWLFAQAAYDELGQPDLALKSLQAALKVDPVSFRVRSALGNWLYRHERYDEAAEHLIWCVRHRPQDRKLRKLAERAKTKQLRTANDHSTRTSRMR